MHRINEKTVKYKYTNFCQPVLELEKFNIFAKIELEKIKFPNSNLIELGLSKIY